MVRAGRSRMVALAAVVALAAGLGLSNGPVPRIPGLAGAPAASPGVSVPVFPAHLDPVKVVNQAAVASTVTEDRGWPQAATAKVALTAPISANAGAVGAAAAASGSPVTLQAVAGPQGTYTGPTSAGVQVLSHTDATRLGVAGVVFAVSGTSAVPGKVGVSLDYKQFAQEYGGDYGSRLSLVQMPACALTTPQVASCRTQTPITTSTNQAQAQSLKATVALGGPDQRQRQRR